MRDRLIVITGSGSGIGRATAVRLAQRGARLALVDVDDEAVARVSVEALEAGSPRVVSLRCDVSSETEVQEAFDEIVEEEGVFDGVFANAGIEVNGPLHETDIAQWNKIIGVNLTGIFLTCKHALRHLVAAHQCGSVVCSSSPSAFVGFAGGGNAAYASSKGGISALVRSAALDYAHAGIRINAVVPGATDTPMLLSTALDQSQPEEVRHLQQAASQQIPLGRLADPAEIAAAVIWLLSEESSYVTGSNLVCDGGLMAKSANTF